MIGSLKKAGYVLLPLAAYYIVHDVARILLMYILQLCAGSSAAVGDFLVRYDTVFGALISIADMLAGTAVLIFLMKKDEDELALADYVNLNGISFYREDRRHPAYVSWAVLAVQAVCSAVGLNMLISLAGITDSSYEQTGSAQYSVPIWLGILLYGIISPAVEELLFRVVIFGRMKRCFPYIISIVVSSLFFGLYHGNLVQGIYGTAMGILMCLALEYVHTAAAAFMFHSLANISVYLLSSFRVFGTEPSLSLCLAFLIPALLLLIWELWSSAKSRRECGIPNGIAYVGCFFIDETLFEEE